MHLASLDCQWLFRHFISFHVNEFWMTLCEELIAAFIPSRPMYSHFLHPFDQRIRRIRPLFWRWSWFGFLVHYVFIVIPHCVDVYFSATTSTFSFWLRFLSCIGWDSWAWSSYVGAWSSYAGNNYTCCNYLCTCTWCRFFCAYYLFSYFFAEPL